MNLDQQVKTLHAQLLRELNFFPTGSKFYSLREIERKYRVHRGVIDAALEQMKHEKLLYAVPKTGLFSNVTLPKDCFRVGLARTDWPSETCHRWEQAAIAYTQEHRCWQLTPMVYQGAGKELKDINVANLDALLIRYWHVHFSPSDMRWFSEQTIPIVMLGNDIGDFPVSMVGSADGDGALAACHYLWQRGHRNVLLILSEPGERVRNWSSNFPFLAKKLDMNCTVLDCHTQSFSYSRQSAYEALHAYLAERNGRADFTAVYVIAGGSVPGVMRALRDFEYRIPEDISIISQSDETEGEFLHPALTLMAYNIAEEINATFDGLYDCLTGKQKFFAAKVPQRIIERDSVADGPAKL